MAGGKRGTIRVGIGGWTYEPWRGVFYPEGLPHRRELEHAAGLLSAIEVNGTYYGAQKPETFARWHDETPEDFVFSLKAPRYATNRRVLAEAGPTIERFLSGGVMELKNKLGPINWQFMATKAFDADDFAAFLKLLPARHEGRTLRHAVEVRHASFACPEFVALAREHGVAIVLAGDSEHPSIPDATADFAYVRIMGTSEGEPQGYDAAGLDRWARRARALAAGKHAPGLKAIAGKADGVARDVFLFVISGHKVANPAAAQALIGRLG